jgi:hypothetical protein
MPEDVESLLDRVCEMVARRIDPPAIEAAKRRQADAMAWRRCDYLPIQFHRPVPEADRLPTFDWRQQFHDPAKSLYMQLRGGVLPRLAARADWAPCVRADTGVINCMSVFGVEYAAPEHTKPVVTRYVGKERLAAFEPPEDVRDCGVMPRMVEHMEHHLAALRRRGLGQWVTVHHCDQQGPFDIAAQVRGHDIFVDLYEDPDFVHALMAKCVTVYVVVSKLCKQVTGERLDGGCANGVWMDNGGVRMCGDSDILIGPELFERFVLPYQQEAFEAFGGGWLHYCGGVRGYRRAEGVHLHPLYARNRYLRGLNWTTAGDWVGELRRLKDLRVAHVGDIQREPGEPLGEYFRRGLRAYDDRTGIVFQCAQLGDGEHERAPDAWREAQDEVFG